MNGSWGCADLTLNLFYRQYGNSGRPLVILHGRLGSSGNWHTLSKNVFSKRFRVFAVDQRNHGRSPHSDRLDYEAMAGDLKTFIDKHNLSPAHLLGHSMGGKTAMRFALDHPEDVDKLVVADMSPAETDPGHQELLEALRALDLPAYDARKDIDAALAERIKSQPVRQFLLKNLDLDAESNNYSWKMNLEAIYRSYDALNEAIDGEPFEGPACFIGGGNSDYVTEEAKPEIKRLFPRAEIVVIPGAGHWLHADQPEAFSEAVMRFLED